MNRVETFTLSTDPRFEARWSTSSLISRIGFAYPFPTKVCKPTAA